MDLLPTLTRPTTVRDLAARGHTVIVSSHVLAEIERMGAALAAASQS